MPERAEIVRQIGALIEELGRAVEEERAAGSAEARTRIEALTADLERMRARGDADRDARHRLEQELEVAEKRIETLVQKLKDARQAAAEAGEEAQRALRRQLEALQQECDEARAELETERSVRKRLEKGAAANEKRLVELEKSQADKSPAVATADGDGKEVERLRGELEAAFAAVVAERQARENAEEELAEAHKLIEALEKSLKNRPVVEAPGSGAPAEELRRMTEQLRAAEGRLEQARREGGEQAAACAKAERRVAELEAALKAQAKAAPTGEAVAGGGKPAGEKALPHELRPAPRPGALFRPDWDLHGLPCKSAEQVLQAWESVSNVQLSLEGYPSQYCSAYLVVIKQGKLKQLYILFNLRMNKHTLVCVPAKPPTDEASLTKALGEAMKYLRMSGFELDKIKPADIAHQLEHYFPVG